MKGMPVTVIINFATCNFGLLAQKSILHACHFQWTCGFIACEYQVTFELYRMYTCFK